MSRETPEKRENSDRFNAMVHLLGKELSSRTILFHAAIAERLGLNATDHKALDWISRNAGATAGQLAEYSGLTTGTVTGILDRLERAGFVRRVHAANDRRQILLYPLPDRMPEIERLFAPLAEAMQELASRYSDVELAVIQDFVERCLQITQDQTARLRRERT